MTDSAAEMVARLRERIVKAYIALNMNRERRFCNTVEEFQQRLASDIETLWPLIEHPAVGLIEAARRAEDSLTYLVGPLASQQDEEDGKETLNELRAALRAFEQAAGAPK